MLPDLQSAIRRHMATPYPVPSPAACPIRELDETADFVHQILAHFGYAHGFLGGYAMKFLYERRAVSSIDVEIKKPFFGGWRQLANVFFDTGAYHILDQRYATEKTVTSRRVVMRIVDMKTGVHIYILKRHKGSPKKYLLFDNKPFYSVTDLLIEKLRCCAERKYFIDPSDAIFLYNFHKNEIDAGKVRKKISPDMRAKILQRYPHDESLMLIIQSLDLLPENPRTYDLKAVFKKIVGK